MDTSGSLGLEDWYLYSEDSSVGDCEFIEYELPTNYESTSCPPTMETIGIYFGECCDELVEPCDERFEFIQRTSTTIDQINPLISKPISLIHGLGAVEFRKELETLEYSDEIKEFYKGGRELVEKLNLFK